METDPRWQVSAASADMSDEPDTPASPALNPWFTMWRAPRRTVRSLMNAEHRPGWIPVVALAGVNQALLWLLNNNAFETRTDFENEIDTHTCYPLLIDGEVIAWISRAHAFGTAVIVQRCVEFDPSVVQTAGNRHGGLKAGWERVVKGGGAGLRFAALSVPGWNPLSSPSFCGRHVAYWTVRAGRLGLAIYDLIERAVVASGRLSQSEPETDHESAMPQPRWDANCSVATFSTQAGRLSLRVSQERTR